MCSEGGWAPSKSSIQVVMFWSPSQWNTFHILVGQRCHNKVAQIEWLQQQKCIIPCLFWKQRRLDEGVQGSFPFPCLSPRFWWPSILGNFWWQSLVLLGLQKRHPDLCLCVHMAFSLRVSVFRSPHFYKDPNRIALRPTLFQYHLVFANYISTPLFPNKVTFFVTEE